MTVEGRAASCTVEDGQCLEGAGGQIRGLSRCALDRRIEHSRRADKCGRHLGSRSARTRKFVLKTGRYTDDRVLSHSLMLRPLRPRASSIGLL